MDAVTETVNTYNTFAEDYKQRYLNDKDGNKMQVFLDKFLNYLGDNNKVLDIGSGVGFDAKYLSDAGADVTSIDIA
jgi:protein-L-isoaspartate O-methyltransferase